MPARTMAACLALVAALAGCRDERAAMPAAPALAEAGPSTPSPSPSPGPPPRPAVAGAAPGPAVWPRRFTALGTEPFWAARVDATTLVYSTPEDQAGARIAVTRETTAEGLVVTGRLAGQPLVLAVTPGPCSDGMSDGVYPHAVRRTLAGDVQRGCASPD